MSIYRFRKLVPNIDASAWVAESAHVIGDVRLAQGSSVWFGAVLRGDVARIDVGQDTNVQDNCVLHAFTGMPLTLGDRVTVGHMAMLHGCNVGHESLIGMNAVILNRAQIGTRCLVAAGAVVKEGSSFPDGSLIAGAPAKWIRALTEGQIKLVARAAQNYLEYARAMKTQLHRIG